MTGRTLVVALVAALAALSACTATPPPVKAPTTTSTPPPQPARVQPDPAHVATLTETLKTMHDRFKLFGLQSPGPVDVLDNGIGDLWMRGIDGTGTTIALVEGWNDPNIDLAMSRFDEIFDLPQADIRTIYPTGAGHLPSSCPAGMAALGTYGSCEAWAVELELDVEAAHLMAPYAKIVLAVAPADSEITDDAASQVAPPEMMQAVENISAHHLADVISISDNTGESTYTYGKPEIHAQDAGELTAAAAGIPLLVGTGDCGVVQNLAVASSQCGNVSGNPVEPVITLTANPVTARTMSEHIDLDCSGLLRQEYDLRASGEHLMTVADRTINGRLTCAEVLGHREFVLTRLFPSA